MKKEFSKKQIAQIATKVRQFKKLFVTTQGQMFTRNEEADEAVRAKNAILDDQNEYIGVQELTEDMVTDAKLKEYAKDPEAFAKLFDSAKIPVTKKKEQPERKREAPAPEDPEMIESVESALGIVEEKQAEKVTAQPEQKKELFGTGK